MSRDILINPNRGSTASGQYPEIQFKGTTTSTPIKLKVDDDGSVVFTGTYGALFNITDNKDGLLHSVNDISGFPIFSVYSYDYVQMGKWDKNTLTVNSDKVGVGLTAPSVKFHISSTSSGAFRLVDTTQASGYVLTSDANGVGTWQPSSGGGGGGVTASNGLTSSGSIIKLGGGLTEHTLITNVNNAFTMSSTGSTIYFERVNSVAGYTNTFKLNSAAALVESTDGLGTASTLTTTLYSASLASSDSISSSNISVQPALVQISSSDGVTSTGFVSTPGYVNVDGGAMNLTMYTASQVGGDGSSNNNMIVTDGASSKGLVYAGDYTANFTTYSLVTKGYVSSLGGVTGSGIVGYVPRWSSSVNISATGSIYDTGVRVGVGITLSNAIFHVSNTSTTIPLIIASGSSTNDLVRITQIGAGNAFVVEDSANPDTSGFVISGVGDTGIGTSSIASTKLSVYSAGTSSATNIALFRDTNGANIASFRSDGNIQLGANTKQTSVVISALANQTNIFRILSASGNEHFGYDSINNLAGFRMGHSTSGGSFSALIKDYWFYSANDTKPALSITGQAAFNQTHVGIGASASSLYKLWVYKERTAYNAPHYGQRIEIVGSASSANGTNNTTYGLDIQNTGTYSQFVAGFRYSSVGINMDINGSDLNIGEAISVSGTYSNIGLTISVSGGLLDNIGLAVNSGSFRYARGSANGYILMSDSNGFASWTASGTVSAIGTVNKYTATQSFTGGTTYSFTHNLSSPSIVFNLWDEITGEQITSVSTKKISNSVLDVKSSVSITNGRVVIVS